MFDKETAQNGNIEIRRLLCVGAKGLKKRLFERRWMKDGEETCVYFLDRLIVGEKIERSRVGPADGGGGATLGLLDGAGWGQL